MTDSAEARSERYVRYSQRTLLVVLFLVLVLGALGLATAIRPELGARWMIQAGWVLPLVIVIAFGAVQRATLRSVPWRPDAPEAQAVLRDEWRRANMDRALRVAFVVVLVAQVPLAGLLASLPSLRAVLAMAVATSVLGLAAFLALFLFFGRERTDG